MLLEQRATLALGHATPDAELDPVVQGVGPALSDALGVGTVVVAITYLSLIVGELVPKQIALREPEAVAAKVAPAMVVLSKFALPLVWLLDASGKLVLRLLGQSGKVSDGVTDEQPAPERPAYQPDRYGDRWAPVLIGFADAAHVPTLEGTIAGVASPEGISRSDLDYSETLFANNPRDGFTYRPAATTTTVGGAPVQVREFDTLGLRGMGFSAVVIPSNKSFILSVNQPE